MRNLGKDELGEVAQNINSMLVELERVTQEKIYKEQESASLLNTIGQGVVVTNESRIITYSNPAFEKLTKANSADLKGQLFPKVIKVYDLTGRLLPDTYLDDPHLQKGQALTAKVLIEIGEKVPVIVNMAPIIVGGLLKGIIWVFYDYTNELNFQQQKDDFFSIASHELRTPMTIIAGNIANVLQGIGGSELTDDDLEALQDAKVSTDTLITIVNDFLNVSRIDQGRLKINFKPVNACEVVEQILEEMAAIVSKKGIELKFNCAKQHELVRADQDKLKEVMVNLIGNSLKFQQGRGVLLLPTKLPKECC